MGPCRWSTTLHTGSAKALLVTLNGPDGIWVHGHGPGEPKKGQVAGDEVTPHELSEAQQLCFVCCTNFFTHIDGGRKMKELCREWKVCDFCNGYVCGSCCTMGVMRVHQPGCKLRAAAIAVNPNKKQKVASKGSKGGRKGGKQAAK